jgi:hypothetical protein
MKDNTTISCTFWELSHVQASLYDSPNFSKTGLTGTSTLRNMLAPRLASIRAMSCGVDTMTAPAGHKGAVLSHVLKCAVAVFCLSAAAFLLVGKDQPSISSVIYLTTASEASVIQGTGCHAKEGLQSLPSSEKQETMSQET